MGIVSSRIKLNNSWTTMTKDGITYSVTLTAPSITSYNLPGGYYPITLEFTADNGSVITKDATDIFVGDELRLTVKETIAPIVTLVQPVNRSVILDPLTPIKFTIIDEQDGSGVDIDTFTMELDGVVFDKDSPEISYTVNANGYMFTYTPPTLMGEGAHTFIIDCDDNDGNSADTFEGVFTVDTTAPVLIITHPRYGDNLWINTYKIRMEGRAYDAYSNPTAVQIEVDGVDQGSVTVDQDGYFTKIIDIKNGINHVTIKATDASGYTTSLTQTYISLNFIFDRTAQDVERIKLLNQRYILGIITEDELEEWYQDSKGALNRSDLVRNESNMEIMNMLFPVGATATVDNITELPTDEYYAELLSNVQKFRNLPYATSSTPRVPTQPLNGYTKWNDIEKILYDIFNVWIKNNRARYFAGNEIYCGDNIGTL